MGFLLIFTKIEFPKLEINNTKETFIETNHFKINMQICLLSHTVKRKFGRYINKMASFENVDQANGINDIYF